VLAEAGITLGERDEVTPALETKIDDTINEIHVSRYAKVTIVDGDDTVDVELVGGLVSTALETAGITLGANDKMDCDAADFLTDNMVITIERQKSVSLEADGETKEILTASETVEDFLKEQGISLNTGDTVSPEAQTVLKDGDKIVVTRYVAPVEEQPDNSQNNYEQQAADNSQYYQEPQQADNSQYYQEPQQAAGRYEVSRVAYPNCADGSHGYYEITYSDGSVEYIEY
ncbi:MAG: DUF348 domain-containing protein, partial [Parasporobacterium sp.]|nr:DUF348 domain-containing protein [Parasporobacterium sp.]